MAFASYANNLVSEDTNGTVDIFVHDMQTGQNTRVSVDFNGAEGNSDLLSPSISADGRYVAFDSYADNLINGDLNASKDVFVHDMQTGQNTRVSVDSYGGHGSSGTEPSFPSISADGRYVAFDSKASSLIDDDTNGVRDVFVHENDVSNIGFSISGNTGIDNVTLNYTDGIPKTATSTADGSYSFTVSSGWSGTVTPVKGRIYFFAA